MSDQCMHSSEHVWYNDGLVLQAVTVECSNVVDWSVVLISMECSDYTSILNIILPTFIGVEASWIYPRQHFRE